MKDKIFEIFHDLLRHLADADTEEKFNEFFFPLLHDALPVWAAGFYLLIDAFADSASCPDIAPLFQGKRAPFLIPKNNPDWKEFNIKGVKPSALYALPIFIEGEIAGAMIMAASRTLAKKELSLLASFGKFASLTLEMSPTLRSKRNSLLDAETGAFNRVAFDAALDEEIKRSDRYRRNFCLMLLRLEGFDEFVRRRGGGKKREALDDMVGALRAKVRDLDIVGLLDRGTFGVILPEGGEKEGKTIAGRILRELSLLPFIGPLKAGRKITPVIGIAVYPRDASFKAVLLEAAEMALDAAAAKRKPAVVVFS